MYVTTLNIYDFKCFGKAKLALQYPGRKSSGASEIPNVNVVLGDNGGGKSSVLRALAIAALAPVLMGSGFVPLRLVRRAREGQAAVDECLLKATALLQPLDRRSAPEAPKGKLELLARIEARSKGNVDRLHLDSTPASPISAMLDDDFSPAFFVVGYGATRRVETSEFSESSARRSRGLRYGRVAGLFEDHVTLRPLHLWLPRLERRSPARAQEVMDLLNAVLPTEIRFGGQVDEHDGQHQFDFEGRPTPLSSLSDGYKAFVAWASDLLGHLSDVAPDKVPLTEIPGIVLVDEIDLHLHPQWQLSVVPTLARVFPRLQFVFTSHSPLVVNTVKRENVFVTDKADDGNATIKQLGEYVYGRSIEQLLLSSYFGLTTTKPASFEAQAETLFHRAADGDADAALAYLAKLMAPSGSDQQAEEAAVKGSKQ